LKALFGLYALNWHVRTHATNPANLCAFLSDGAAEEQRGSDWIPRAWWAGAEDYAV